MMRVTRWQVQTWRERIRELWQRCLPFVLFIALIGASASIQPSITPRYELPTPPVPEFKLPDKLPALPSSLPQAPTVEPDWVITNFDIDIVVAPDNSYFITETIDVQFNKQQHGIFRTIPIESNKTDPVTGKTSWWFPVEVQDIRVANHPFTVEEGDSQLTIRIGRPSQFADPETQYVIRYRYIIGDDGNRDFDEFYYNLIGTQWDAPILNATFSIEMPAPFDASLLNITAGSYGAAGNDENVVYTVEGNRIVGHTTQPLPHFTGVTVALTLPQGYYSEVVRRADWPEYTARAGIILFPMMALAVYALWHKLRRNTIVPTVQFYPPDGINPADAGFIMNGISTSSDITSLIIHWASKGYLGILDYTDGLRTSGDPNHSAVWVNGSNTYTGYRFLRLREMDSHTTKPYEVELFNRLFSRGDGNTVSDSQLQGVFHTDIMRARQGVTEFFTTPPTSIYSHTNALFVILTCALGLLSAFGAGIAATPLSWIYNSGSRQPFIWTLVGMCQFVLFYFVAKYLTNSEKKTIWRWGVALGATIITFLLCRALFSMIYPDPVKIASIILAVIVLAMCGWALSTPESLTPLGEEYRGKLLGFKEFLFIAEKPRLEMLLEENPQYYYETLPFAQVLGVTDQWRKKFADIEMQIVEPYYISEEMHYALNQLTTQRNMLHTAAISGRSFRPSPPPPPSGFSGGSFGGGSVGRGFGGGGGGVW